MQGLHLCVMVVEHGASPPSCSIDTTSTQTRGGFGGRYCYTDLFAYNLHMHMQAAYDAEQEACPPVPTHTRLWHPWMQQQDSGTSAVSGVKQAAQAAAGGGGGGAGRPAYSSTCILAVVGSLGAALGAVCIGMMGSD